MRKKGKATNVCFCPNMGNRNWVKILLVSTTLPPFTTAKKTWSKVLVILFNKCLSIKKKECPNPIIISPNMRVGNLVKEMLPSAP
jgi:hypothetical protein